MLANIHFFLFIYNTGTEKPSTSYDLETSTSELPELPTSQAPLSDQYQHTDRSTDHQYTSDSWNVTNIPDDINVSSLYFVQQLFAHLDWIPINGYFNSLTKLQYPYIDLKSRVFRRCINVNRASFNNVQWKKIKTGKQRSIIASILLL